MGHKSPSRRDTNTSGKMTLLQSDDASSVENMDENDATEMESTTNATNVGGDTETEPELESTIVTNCDVSSEPGSGIVSQYW